MSTIDERQAAAAKIQELLQLLRKHSGGETASMVEECEALARAIGAFHMEGIRFRIFNVDRLLSRHAETLQPEARPLLEEARRHLEASGFHTRSHQAPV